MTIQAAAVATCDQCGAVEVYATTLSAEYVLEQSNYDSTTPPEVKLSFGGLPNGWKSERRAYGYGGQDDLCPKCQEPPPPPNKSRRVRK